MAPEPLRRGRPRACGPLAHRGKPPGGAGRFHVALRAQGRDPQTALGGVPRGLHFGPVGLCGAPALRLCRGHDDRLPCEDLRRRVGEGRGPFPRVDDRCGRPLPAPPRSLYDHRVHHPCHGAGPLHRRQRAAALRRPVEIPPRRAGAALQCRGQALARKGRGELPRCVPHRERHHGQRVQVPAGPRGGRRDAQRFRGRLRVARRGVRPPPRRRARRPDPRGGGVPRTQVRPRAPHRGHEWPLRVPQQGPRCVPRGAQAAGGRSAARPRGAGLHHRAGGQCGAAQGFAGPAGRSVARRRCRAVPLASKTWRGTRSSAR